MMPFVLKTLRLGSSWMKQSLLITTRPRRIERFETFVPGLNLPSLVRRWKIPCQICGRYSGSWCRACFQDLLPSGNCIRSEEHTSELQSRGHLVCRLLLEKNILDRMAA